MIPLGGTRPTEDGRAIPIMPGDGYEEPLSGRRVPIGSAYLDDSQVLPSGGGLQSALDARVMMCEQRVVVAVQAYVSVVSGLLTTSTRTELGK